MLQAWWVDKGDGKDQGQIAVMTQESNNLGFPREYVIAGRTPEASIENN